MKLKRAWSLRTRRAISGYVFISPFVVGFIVLMLMPFILYIFMGFSKQTMGNYGGIEFKPIGFENYYRALFEETDFINQVLASLGDMLITFPSILLYSFFIAIILNQKFKGRGLARAIFFLPVLIASGAASMGQDDALISSAVSAVLGTSEDASDMLNLTAVLMDMLGSTSNAGFFSVIETLVGKIYTITMSSGVQILIFLAALQTISPSLYEASAIEGATAWENFWKITLPMVSPIILVNSVYTIIDVMGNSGNKVINNLYTLSMKEFEYGLSSAMGTLYFGFTFLTLGIVIFIMSRMVYYENR